MPKFIPIAKTLILLLAFGFVYLVRSPFRVSNLKDGYTLPFSVSEGERSELFLNGVTRNRKAVIRLYDLKGVQVDSTQALVIEQSENATSHDKGYKYKSSGEYRVNALKTGIYFWDNQVPMLVKNKNAEILIVFSFFDKHAASKLGGRSFYKYDSKDGKPATKLSIERPVHFDRMSRSFFKWIEDNLDGENYSFVSDQDLESLKQQFPKAKLLVFFGDSRFWSEKQIDSFRQFNISGGNVLIMGSVVMKNRLRFNSSTNQMEFYYDPENDPAPYPALKATSINANGSAYKNYEIIGMDYEFGLTEENAKWSGFKVNKQDHLVFEKTGLKVNDTLALKTALYNSAPQRKVSPNSDSLSIDLSKIGFFSGEMLAYNKGQNGAGMIAVFKKTPKSGVIINIGSTEWVEENNLKREVISRITMNSIKFLSSEKPSSSIQ